MLRRFLEYSLKHGKAIKVIMMEDDRMVTRNITVVHLESDCVSFLSAANRKKPRKIALEYLLSAAYARGDDGTTLRTEKKEGKD